MVPMAETPSYVAGRRVVGTAYPTSLAQELGLLDRELLVGEHAGTVQLGQVLELGDRVRGRSRSGRRRRRLLVDRLLLVLLLLLVGPAVGLAPAHAVRYRRRRSGDSGRACHSSK